MEKKTIVVCGATGQQGSAVTTALLKKNLWHLIGLTRDPNTDKTIALKKKGIEVIAANWLIQDSLVNAFEGADAVFGMTQPWSANYKKLHITDEINAGKNINAKKYTQV